MSEELKFKDSKVGVPFKVDYKWRGSFTEITVLRTDNLLWTTKILGHDVTIETVPSFKHWVGSYLRDSPFHQDNRYVDNLLRDLNDTILKYNRDQRAPISVLCNEKVLTFVPFEHSYRCEFIGSLYLELCEWEREIEGSDDTALMYRVTSHLSDYSDNTYQPVIMNTYEDLISPQVAFDYWMNAVNEQYRKHKNAYNDVLKVLCLPNNDI